MGMKMDYTEETCHSTLPVLSNYDIKKNIKIHKLEDHISMLSNIYAPGSKPRIVVSVNVWTNVQQIPP